MANQPDYTQDESELAWDEIRRVQEAARSRNFKLPQQPLTQNTKPMDRNQFIATYVASWLAARSVQQYTDHYSMGFYPYLHEDLIPIEDAGELAKHAWNAFTKRLEQGLPMDETLYKSNNINMEPIPSNMPRRFQFVREDGIIEYGCYFPLGEGSTIMGNWFDGYPVGNLKWIDPKPGPTTVKCYPIPTFPQQSNSKAKSS